MNKVKILYEDENVLAVDKPAGLIVHPDGKEKEKSVVDFILKKYPETKDVGEPMVLSDGSKIIRPGIVHRIDKETSGILLIAKNNKAFEYLKSQFLERQIKKTYHAFVYGMVNEERGVINKPLGRSSFGVRKWTAGSDIRGDVREAVTKFKVLRKNSEASFVEVWPLTGRTHQIRVHMKSIHHPIVCDSIYASHKLSLFGFKRLALHASKVAFKNLNGKDVEIIAPFPRDFQNAFVFSGIDKNLPI